MKELKTSILINLIYFTVLCAWFWYWTISGFQRFGLDFVSLPFQFLIVEFVDIFSFIFSKSYFFSQNWKPDKYQIICFTPFLVIILLLSISTGNFVLIGYFIVSLMFKKMKYQNSVSNIKTKTIKYFYNNLLALMIGGFLSYFIFTTFHFPVTLFQQSINTDQLVIPFIVPLYFSVLVLFEFWEWKYVHV